VDKGGQNLSVWLAIPLPPSWLGDCIVAQFGFLQESFECTQGNTQEDGEVEIFSDGASASGDVDDQSIVSSAASEGIFWSGRATPSRIGRKRTAATTLHPQKRKSLR